LKTIDTILEAASTGMVGDVENISDIQETYRIRTKEKERMPSTTNLKQTNHKKKYIMAMNAVLDLMWVLICGILVFFMQAVALCRN
jgi:hypothetical protein